MQEFRGRAAIAPLCRAASACWGDRSTLHPGNIWWSALPRHGTVDDWLVAIWSDSAGPLAAAWLEGPHRATILAAPAHPKRDKMLGDAAHWAVKHGDRHELRTDVLEADRAVVGAWERWGMRLRPSPAYLLRDLRDLSDLGDPAPLPGYRVRPVRDTVVDQDARVELHVASWSTTIHLSDFDVDGYAILRQSPYYRPELDVVVEGPDGRLHGSALIWLDELTKVGLLWPVGVRPEKRRMGLGRAVVLSALWALRALGGHEVIVWPRGDNDYPGPAKMFAGLGWSNSGRTISLTR